MLSVIVACTRDGGIGCKGTLPWKIPDELRQFKRITLHSNVIMGRNTWDSLPRKPLPSRRNIVLSKTGFEETGCEVWSSLDDVLSRHGSERNFIIGGACLYNHVLRERLDLIDDIHVSVIGNEYHCDTFIDVDALFKLMDTHRTDTHRHDEYIYHHIRIR